MRAQKPKPTSTSTKQQKNESNSSSSSNPIPSAFKSDALLLRPIQTTKTDEPVFVLNDAIKRDIEYNNLRINELKKNKTSLKGDNSFKIPKDILGLENLSLKNNNLKKEGSSKKEGSKNDGSKNDESIFILNEAIKRDIENQQRLNNNNGSSPSPGIKPIPTPPRASPNPKPRPPKKLERNYTLFETGSLDSELAEMRKFLVVYLNNKTIDLETYKACMKLTREVYKDAEYDYNTAKSVEFESSILMRANFSSLLDVYIQKKYQKMVDAYEFSVNSQNQSEKKKKKTNTKKTQTPKENKTFVSSASQEYVLKLSEFMKRLRFSLEKEKMELLETFELIYLKITLEVPKFMESYFLDHLSYQMTGGYDLGKKDSVPVSGRDAANRVQANLNKLIEVQKVLEEFLKPILRLVSDGKGFTEQSDTNYFSTLISNYFAFQYEKMGLDEDGNAMDGSSKLFGSLEEILRFTKPKKAGEEGNEIRFDVTIPSGDPRVDGFVPYFPETKEFYNKTSDLFTNEDTVKNKYSRPSLVSNARGGRKKPYNPKGKTINYNTPNLDANVSSNSNQSDETPPFESSPVNSFWSQPSSSVLYPDLPTTNYISESQTSSDHGNTLSKGGKRGRGDEPDQSDLERRRFLSKANKRANTSGGGLVEKFTKIGSGFLEGFWDELVEDYSGSKITMKDILGEYEDLSELYEDNNINEEKSKAIPNQTEVDRYTEQSYLESIEDIKEQSANKEKFTERAYNQLMQLYYQSKEKFDALSDDKKRKTIAGAVFGCVLFGYLGYQGFNYLTNDSSSSSSSLSQGNNENTPESQQSKSEKQPSMEELLRNRPKVREEYQNKKIGSTELARLIERIKKESKVFATQEEADIWEMNLKQEIEKADNYQMTNDIMEAHIINYTKSVVEAYIENKQGNPEKLNELKAELINKTKSNAIGGNPYDYILTALLEDLKYLDEKTQTENIDTGTVMDRVFHQDVSGSANSVESGGMMSWALRFGKKLLGNENKEADELHTVAMGNRINVRIQDAEGKLEQVVVVSSKPFNKVSTGTSVTNAEARIVSEIAISEEEVLKDSSLFFLSQQNQKSLIEHMIKWMTFLKVELKRDDVMKDKESVKNIQDAIVKVNGFIKSIYKGKYDIQRSIDENTGEILMKPTFRDVSVDMENFGSIAFRYINGQLETALGDRIGLPEDKNTYDQLAADSVKKVREFNVDYANDATRPLRSGYIEGLYQQKGETLAYQSTIHYLTGSVTRGTWTIKAQLGEGNNDSNAMKQFFGVVWDSIKNDFKKDFQGLGDPKKELPKFLVQFLYKLLLKIGKSTFALWFTSSFPHFLASVFGMSLATATTTAFLIPTVFGLSTMGYNLYQAHKYDNYNQLVKEYMKTREAFEEISNPGAEKTKKYEEMSNMLRKLTTMQDDLKNNLNRSKWGKTRSGLACGFNVLNSLHETISDPTNFVFSAPLICLMTFTNLSASMFAMEANSFVGSFLVNNITNPIRLAAMSRNTFFYGTRYLSSKIISTSTSVMVYNQLKKSNSLNYVDEKVYGKNVGGKGKESDTTHLELINLRLPVSAKIFSFVLNYALNSLFSGVIDILGDGVNRITNGVIENGNLGEMERNIAVNEITTALTNFEESGDKFFPFEKVFFISHEEYANYLLDGFYQDNSLSEQLKYFLSLRIPSFNLADVQTKFDAMCLLGLPTKDQFYPGG